MDMLSFALGVLLGVGLPFAVVEVRDFLYQRKVNRMAPEMPAVWAYAPPRLQCPLPSPHSKHDERTCAISWYLKHQERAS